MKNHYYSQGERSLVRGHWFWDFLQRSLSGFYSRHGMRWQTYSGLLYGLLVQNQAPHSDWHTARTAPGAPLGNSQDPRTRVAL
jgi:hypothetical protein